MRSTCKSLAPAIGLFFVVLLVRVCGVPPSKPFTDATLRSEIAAIPQKEMLYGTYRDICERVYGSQNTDLISLCWEHPALNREIRFFVLQEQNPEFRARLVLMILKASPKAWMDEADPHADDIGAAGARGLLVDYCNKTLRKIFPPNLLKQYSLRDREARREVSILLEKALATKPTMNFPPKASESIPAPSSTEKNGSPLVPQQNQSLSTTDTNQTLSTAPADAKHQPIRSSFLLWVAIAGFVAILLTAAIRFKRKQRP